MSLETRSLLHLLFESIAYLVAARIYLAGRQDRSARPISNWVLVGAVLGAAIGSKLVFWLQRPDVFVSRWSEPTLLLGGKTILGGLLGGVLGVELVKSLVGEDRSTGDGFVVPILVGLMIGRIGCYFGGLGDATYGLPTGLPWGVDFGDGIARHPTQLYEIVFAGVCLVVLPRADTRRAGDRFKLLMCAYLTWRFVIEFLKPSPFLYAQMLTGIQLAALAGLLYYGPHSFRIGRQLWRPR